MEGRLSPRKKTHVFQFGVWPGQTHSVQPVHTHTHTHTQNCPKVPVSEVYGVLEGCADRSYVGTLNSETKLKSAITVALKYICPFGLLQRSWKPLSVESDAQRIPQVNTISA